VLINPIQYFIKRYHSPDLSASELKRMLNLWLPFILNQIKIISISEDFYEANVKLKRSFFNKSPKQFIWGGSISSTLDPFFPIMMKQIILKKGIFTDFYSKAMHINFIKVAKTNLTFNFKINKKEVILAEESLNKNNKYDGWHRVDGIDENGNVCVVGKVQVYLRKRK
tara:strand:- start:287 stop:790 length:504 start_codon:yes stop_codon:yes gene_type:complete